MIDTNVILVIFFFLGLVFGSFGNVLIFRLPAQKSIGGRSHCPHCNRTLKYTELIPVLSFVMQRGRCRGCGKTISIQYPLVELSSGILFVIALYLSSRMSMSALSLSTVHLSLSSLILALALWSLLILSVIDLRTQTIPDILSFAVLACGLLFHLFTGGTIDVSGMLLGGLFFAAIYFMSRRRWIGSGDVFLGAAIGMLLGSWQMMLVALFAAYIIGAIVASILLLTKRATRTTPVPFGPFLALGAIVALMGGDTILQVIL